MAYKIERVLQPDLEALGYIVYEAYRSKTLCEMIRQNLGQSMVSGELEDSRVESFKLVDLRSGCVSPRALDED